MRGMQGIFPRASLIRGLGTILAYAIPGVVRVKRWPLWHGWHAWHACHPIVVQGSDMHIAA
jgi:hypothetical protein